MTDWLGADVMNINAVGCEADGSFAQKLSGGSNENAGEFVDQPFTGPSILCVKAA